MDKVEEIEDFMDENLFLRCTVSPLTILELLELLKFQFNVQGIHDDIITHIKQKIMGNPLEAIQYMESLIKENGVSFKSKKTKKGKIIRNIIPAEVFLKC